MCSPKTLTNLKIPFCAKEAKGEQRTTKEPGQAKGQDLYEMLPINHPSARHVSVDVTHVLKSGREPCPGSAAESLKNICTCSKAAESLKTYVHVQS